ncbi:hypothetical protein D3C81_1518670 [compost metagenome]
MLGDPALQIDLVRARDLVVMEGVINALPVQPDARLLHRVAGLDAVQGDGHGTLPRIAEGRDLASGGEGVKFWRLGGNEYQGLARCGPCESRDKVPQHES